MLGVGGRERTEAWCVRGRLGAELGEIEIGAGAVADVHGFAEALFGVVSVEYYAVEDDGYAFKNYFDQAAN